MLSFHHRELVHRRLLGDLASGGFKERCPRVAAFSSASAQLSIIIRRLQHGASNPRCYLQQVEKFARLLKS